MIDEDMKEFSGSAKLWLTWIGSISSKSI